MKASVDVRLEEPETNRVPTQTHVWLLHLLDEFPVCSVSACLCDCLFLFTGWCRQSSLLHPVQETACLYGSYLLYLLESNLFSSLQQI